MLSWLLARKMSIGKISAGMLEASKSAGWQMIPPKTEGNRFDMADSDS